MAEEFVERIKDHSEVIEVGIVGSVASCDCFAMDCDLAVVMEGFSDMEKVAKAARQMSRVSQYWDVFVFDSHLNYRGRICQRKACPATSVECYVPGCGEIPHLKIIKEFEFDEKKLFASKVDIIWAKRESLLKKLQKEILKSLDLKGPKSYQIYKDKVLICRDCGEEFVWEGGEQKYFEQKGFSPPFRCPECRPVKCF